MSALGLTIPRWLVVGLILAGAAVLSVSARQTKELIDSLDSDQYERIWTVLLGLIATFVVGYLVAGAGIAAGTGPATNLDVLLGGIFFLGSLFVLLAVRVSNKTISRLQETSYSRDYLSTVVDSIGEGLLIVSPSGEIRRVNSTLCALVDGDGDSDTATESDRSDGFLATQSSAVVGSPIESLFGAEPVLSTETIERDIAALPIAGEETTLQAAGGREIPVLVSAAPLQEDDKLTGIVCTARDISDRKQFEHELKRKNERLEQYATIISHDLRNPLGIAEMYIDFAEESTDPDDFAAVREAHDRMDEMIDDLLALARVRDTVRELDPVDVAGLATEVWEAARTDQGTLNVDLPENWAVYGDAALLKLILENLFSNAISHNDEPVTITVGALDAEGFFIEDDGCGIDAADREEVFEYGYTNAEDGTGFGLYIVADVASAHGWEVRVVEGSEGGARFEFTGVDTTQQPASG